MLGENHSLAHEFPEHVETIVRLTEQDSAFAEQSKHYNYLDNEIRKLELRGSPINDLDMNKLKLERAELKDMLHNHLINAK